VLFPDTFTNHFHTDVAKAVCEVIEAAGFEVTIPPKVLCCGRPLFDYGMLGRARAMFQEVLDTLDEQITEGLPMIVPEPSCGASFRDELIEMLPEDRQAQRLSKQTFTLAEFLEKYAPDAELPRIERKALVQKHCHHQSVMGFDADEKLLKRLGIDADLPPTGCCGLAGSWGFENEKYQISMDCGERELFPKVREADTETILLADGFSCRTQIEQGTSRRAMHIAQVIQAGLPDRRSLPKERPERLGEQTSQPASPTKEVAAAVTVAAAGAAAAGLVFWRRAKS
jgi:Fe-S oxidoreductase